MIKRQLYCNTAHSRMEQEYWEGGNLMHYKKTHTMTKQSLNTGLENVTIWHNCIPVSPRLTKGPSISLHTIGKATVVTAAETQARCGSGPSLDLWLSCSGLPLMVHTWHLQEPWLHYQWCFKTRFKAHFPHLFNSHKLHPCFLTNDSPTHGFPTIGLSCNNSSLMGHLL